MRLALFVEADLSDEDPKRMLDNFILRRQQSLQNVLQLPSLHLMPLQFLLNFMRDLRCL